MESNDNITTNTRKKQNNPIVEKNNKSNMHQSFIIISTNTLLRNRIKMISTNSVG